MSDGEEDGRVASMWARTECGEERARKRKPAAVLCA